MPTDEEIRDLVAIRAFEISRQRRPDEGDELSDWLRAEAEVLEEIRSASQRELTGEAAQAKSASHSEASES